MVKIVEIILDSMATFAGEQLGEMIKKYKLNKFIANLEREIQEDYINQYQNESYFMSLDNFLETSKFYVEIVRRIFSSHQSSSISRYSSECVHRFVEQNIEFRPIERQIEAVVKKLSKKIYTEFLNNDILDANNKLYIRVQEQMNLLLENVGDIYSELKEMRREFRSFYTYSLQKQDEKKIGKDEYLKLHNILCDENIPFVEKEISYIEWISENQDLKEGLVYIADNCVKLGNLERAKKYYKYILQNNEDEYELYNNWGIIELNQGFVDEAIKRFNVVLQHDEHNINALYNLAVSYYQKRTNIDIPLQYIEKAFNIASEDADVVSLYAVILLENNTNNCIQVIEMLNAALEKEPRNFYLNINLGFCYLFQKKFEQGIELLEWLNGEYKNEILCISLLAMMYAMLGVERADKAIPLFEQVYKLTEDEGYLDNIYKLKQGNFFDSVVYNQQRIQIYSDQEMIEYWKFRFNGVCFPIATE